MSRFVIEGFSAGGETVGVVDFCGSEGGAACPLVRVSTLGTAIPLPFAGFESGEPRTEDACDDEGDFTSLSRVRAASRGPLTVAMIFGWLRS